MEALGTLPNIRDLAIAESEITDAGIANLQRLLHLEALDLSETKITDDALRQLAGHPAARVLAIERHVDQRFGIQVPSDDAETGVTSRSSCTKINPSTITRRSRIAHI